MFPFKTEWTENLSNYFGLFSTDRRSFKVRYRQRHIGVVTPMILSSRIARCLMSRSVLSVQATRAAEGQFNNWLVRIVASDGKSCIFVIHR